MTAEELKRRAQEELEYQAERKAHPPRPVLDKEDFIHYHDEAFVDNAYWLIFHRPPDPEGKAYYLDHLRSGRRSKMQIVANMAASEEARDKGVAIRHIRFYRTLSLLYKIPGLSYVVQWTQALLGLPRLVRRHNALETALYAHTSQQCRELEDRWREALSEHRGETSRRIREWGERFEGEERERALRRDRAYAELRRELERRLEDVERAWKRLEGMRELYERVARRLEEDLSAATEPERVEAAAVSETLEAEFYRALEARFRGSEEEIERHLRRYLPWLEELSEPAPALDLGCGRGEWLRLLGAQGIDASGVDLNPLFAERLRKEGLRVEQAEALSYLRSLPDASLGLVSGFHIVEHLPFSQLMALLREIQRVLRPGGMVLFETPNPRNLGVGACDFYTDPTHRAPLPPHLLEFLLEYAGFRHVRSEPAQTLEPLILEDPTLQPFVDDWVAQAPDYAVRGIRP